MVHTFFPTKSSGYPREGVGVSVWLVNRMVGSLVPLLAT